MNRQKNLLEQAISEYFEDIDPRHNRLLTEEVEKIRNAINKTGEWTQQEVHHLHAPLLHKPLRD